MQRPRLTKTRGAAAAELGLWSVRGGRRWRRRVTKAYGPGLFIRDG